VIGRHRLLGRQTRQGAGRSASTKGFEKS